MALGDWWAKPLSPKNRILRRHCGNSQRLLKMDTKPKYQDNGTLYKQLANGFTPSLD